MLLVSVVSIEPVWAQADKRISIDVKEQSVRTVLNIIKKEAGVNFVYDESLIPRNKKITVRCDNMPFGQVVDQICSQLGLRNEREKNYIMLLPGRKESAATQYKYGIGGKVTDTKGMPLVGATIRLKSSNTKGTVSYDNGSYNLLLDQADMSSSLVASMIGYKSVEMRVPGESMNFIANFMLEEDQAEIEEIVVNGIFERPKSTSSGASATYGREQLMEVGNQNLLKSLGNLDPSFQIIEDMTMGSNPNSLPNIQLRGATQFSDLEGEYTGNPNQPLFILDGFETTLQKVYDLDMNRVSSVTILKDAAAKAIYGSKAGNGVVVIQTIRPRSGELVISYTGSVDVEMPDLTGYNLMNAQEKLDYEVERGMYVDNSTSGTQTQQLRYQTHLNNVLRGVDTYWLSQPLRTGVGQKHSLNVDGGDSRMRYSAGFSYNNIAGVMKGSDRNTMEFYTTLAYTYKNIIFRNTLDYTRNWAKDSPYGTFSDYAELNPYWSPYDEDGNLVQVLGTIGNMYTGSQTYYNPLYNATLNTKSESAYTDIRDNFAMEWKINDDLMMRGQFSYTRTENSSDKFYPPSHTKFILYDDSMSDRKGEYTKSYSSSQQIASNISLNYNKTVGKHLLFANLTWNIDTNRSASNSYYACGFGNDSMDDISFAIQYYPNSTPSGSNSKVREIGAIGALSYSYDDRYMVDATLRETGSSLFGSDNRWGTFWSLGAGWNVHNESFWRKSEWVKQFKIRGSIGYTGTQNFDPFQARARYQYLDYSYDGRYGAQMMGLANSSLGWQRNMDYNVGADVTIKSFLNIKLDYYVQTTDNLLADITVPSSMGFSTYKDNMGTIENRGYEVSMQITPWRNSEKRAWLGFTLNAQHNENRLKNISDIFGDKNDSNNASKDTSDNSYDSTLTNDQRLENQLNRYTKPSTLYYDGQSMNAIWGVRSLGIDPMTGKELYLDIDGNPTWDWSSKNQVVIGDTTPKLRGTFGINAGYMGFSFSATCSYQFGGDIYNSTLVSKVEDISGRTNLDRRVFDAWKQAGDESPYKQPAFSHTISSTKPTSRFIQKNNEVYVSSMNIGYDFYNSDFLKRLRIERIKLTFYTNNFMRFSSIDIERGTSYPFARNYSFQAMITF